MDNFSGFERKLANLLSRFPHLKLKVKKLYQRIVYFSSGRNTEVSCVYKYRILESVKESFFGYYDKSPVNTHNQYALFHRSSHYTSRYPEPEFPVDIVVYNLKNDKELFHLHSRAYNWQQGSRLHWLDEDRFIFNDFESGEFIARIGSVKSREVISVIDFPVYDTFGGMAISLNYERLDKLRPDYGYRNKRAVREIDLTELDNDGVFRIDLENNLHELIIPLRELANYKLDVPGNTLHKVNHLMFSPEGDKFIFLHRYFIGERKFDRLILANLEGKILNILADDQMISHYCWADNDVVIAYMRQFGSGDNFFKIDTNTLTTKILNKDLLEAFGDGHPTVNLNQMLFDTYPNKARMKELFIYDMTDGQLQKVGEFFESFKYYGETRCDLHPRWSQDGRYIFFDSVHTGERRLYMIDLKNNSNK